ncbi:MAG: hypothetical protein IKZ54_08970 [Bacteroidales bacterium]|nr:hypothetical protein [Bacteroidales bacterium]
MSVDIMGIFMIIILVIGCCVVLPLMIVWLTNKRKNHEIDKKTEILMALLEKNPDLDPAEVMNKLNMSQESGKKSLREKLLEKLMTGCICTLIGIVLFFTHLFGFVFLGDKTTGVVGGGVLTAVGIALIIHYFVSKKMLQSEIATEEKRITEQQISE